MEFLKQSPFVLGAVVLSATVFSFGCDPGRFSDLRDQATVVGLVAPAEMGRPFGVNLSSLGTARGASEGSSALVVSKNNGSSVHFDAFDTGEALGMRRGTVTCRRDDADQEAERTVCDTTLIQPGSGEFRTFAAAGAVRVSDLGDGIGPCQVYARAMPTDLDRECFVAIPGGVGEQPVACDTPSAQHCQYDGRIAHCDLLAAARCQGDPDIACPAADTFQLQFVADCENEAQDLLTSLDGFMSFVTLDPDRPRRDIEHDPNELTELRFPVTETIADYKSVRLISPGDGGVPGVIVSVERFPGALSGNARADRPTLFVLWLRDRDDLSFTLQPLYNDAIDGSFVAGRPDFRGGVSVGRYAAAMPTDPKTSLLVVSQAEYGPPTHTDATDPRVLNAHAHRLAFFSVSELESVPGTTGTQVNTELEGCIHFSSDVEDPEVVLTLAKLPRGSGTAEPDDQVVVFALRSPSSVPNDIDGGMPSAGPGRVHVVRVPKGDPASCSILEPFGTGEPSADTPLRTPTTLPADAVTLDWCDLSSSESGCESFGAAVTVGRLNSDGFSDLAIGMPDAEAQAGAVQVLAGTSQGLDWYRDVTAVGTSPFHTMPHPDVRIQNRFGSALTTLDRFEPLMGRAQKEELAVGAPGADGGRVYIFRCSGLGDDRPTKLDPVCEGR